MTSSLKTLRVVVEGIGDIVENRYAPALFDQYTLAKNHGKSLDVIFIDESAFWDNSSSQHTLIDKRRKFIKQIKKWATYIDKTQKTGFKTYKSLKSDVVIIATPDETHVVIALEWLTKPKECKHIFLEKPIDSSLSRARSLQYYSQFSQTNVYALDHYLARFIPLTVKWVMDGYLKELGGEKLKTMTFYILEDKSEPYNGPIEAANRNLTLKHGLVLDMFPHVLAILGLYGKLETIILTGLKIARYSFDTVDGTRAMASIKKETFAEIRFTIESRLGNTTRNPTIIEVVTYLGKGISQSTGEKKENSSMKRVEIQGQNKKRLVIDLTSRGSVEVRNHRNKVVTTGPPIIGEPYEELVEQIVEKFLWGKNIDLFFLLDLQKAKNTLTFVHEIMTLVENFRHLNISLPTYHIKTSVQDGIAVSLAPTLEQVLQTPLLDVYSLVGTKPLTAFYVSDIKRRRGEEGIPH